MASTSQIRQTLRTQIQELNRHAEHLDQLSHTDFEGARLKALQVAEEMVDLLATSKEKLSRRIFTPNLNMCVRVALELDLFSILSRGRQSSRNVQHRIVTKQEPPPSKPLSESQQQVQDASRNDLVVRILRVLAAGGFIEEVGDNVYAPNSMTQALTEPAHVAMFIHNFEIVLPTTIQMPTYLLQNSHALSPSQTPFQFSHQTSLSYFDWLLAHPPLHDRFNTSMRANRLDQPFWASWFPVREQLLADFDQTVSDGGGDAVFLVDIGGNTGYDLLRLRKSLSEQDGDTADVVGREGCLVLQDLPEVIESISEEEVWSLDEAGVRRQKHDFLMPQPIQGAHIYFMHFILHDFPNSVARLIIYNIAMSMTPNRSRLLLNEIILPTRGVSLQMALWDVQMMTLLGGRERTKSEWVELVEDSCSIGERLRIEVVRFWLPPSGAGEGIIEITRRA